ncbi:TPA: Fic family protein [Providencia rettgeri]|nr:Fic family protein [Providencia rettgeri]
MWIWEEKAWPQFTFDYLRLQPVLRKATFLQGKLNGCSLSLDNKGITLDAVLANIIYSSDIEGEKLDARSVRSSLANHLGITTDVSFPVDKRTDGLVESSLDAINNLDELLTNDRLLKWHSLLFQEEGLFYKIQPGSFRTGAVQVVSGRLDRPVIHYEAPSGKNVTKEIEAFTRWFNDKSIIDQADPILRAGIAHLWFLTIHPFDDGNGRIGRLIMDLALAQAEKTTIRLYAMSQSINQKRKEYYDVLERTQRGGLDITEWLLWFTETLCTAINRALNQIAQTVEKASFWNRFDQSKLTQEQSKVINRLLDGDFVDGINNRQYMSVAKVSRSTATRHLADMVKMGILTTGAGGGRSTRYKLNSQ